MSNLTEEQKRKINILDDCSYAFVEMLYEDEGVTFEDAMVELEKQKTKHGAPIWKTHVYPDGHAKAGKILKQLEWTVVPDDPAPKDPAPKDPAPKDGGK